MVSASVCVLVASMAVFSKAQIPSLGWCPDYLPMADFEMDRFLGKWYEAEHYFTLSEVANRCVVTDYAKSANGRIYISSEVTSTLTGIKRIFGGNLELAGKGTEGKMNVKYTTSPLNTESTLVVLDTDYDNYAVVWSCRGIGPIHTQNAWLMTRERLASGAVLQRAYGVLDSFKISRTFFVKTDQQGCALVASDINAANGITSSSTVPQAIGTEQKGVEPQPSLEKVVDTKQKGVKPKPSLEKVVEDAITKSAPKDESKPEDSAEQDTLKPETVPQHILSNVVQQGGENSEKKNVQAEGSS